MLCLTLMGIGNIGCDEVMQLIRTPAEVFADSKIYLDIYIWGLPFVFFYNIATGIFSAMGVAGVAWATFLCQGVSCILALLYFFAGRQLLYLFMSDPTDVAVQTGINYLRILSPFYFVISAKLVADGVLRGNEMMGKFMTSTFTDLILRVVFTVLLSQTFLGATGIWCSWPIGWTVATVMAVLFYRGGPWKEAARQC